MTTLLDQLRAHERLLRELEHERARALLAHCARGSPAPSAELRIQLADARATAKALWAQAFRDLDRESLARRHARRVLHR